MKWSMNMRRSVYVSGAFAALLLVIGASSYAIWRNATSAQDRISELHDQHLQAGSALADLRANVYLVGILTRDYLLDSDVSHIPLYVSQIDEIRSDTDKSFRALEQLSLAEVPKGALGQL